MAPTTPSLGARQQDRVVGAVLGRAERRVDVAVRIGLGHVDRPARPDAGQRVVDHHQGRRVPQREPVGDVAGQPLDAPPGPAPIGDPSSPGVRERLGVVANPRATTNRTGTMIADPSAHQEQDGEADEGETE